MNVFRKSVAVVATVAALSLGTVGIASAEDGTTTTGSASGSASGSAEFLANNPEALAILVAALLPLLASQVGGEG